MHTVRGWLRDNGLVVVFAALFLGCLAFQSASGLAAYNDVLRTHGRPPISYAAYVTTGDFLAGIFSNWQAAVLQLACLIVFGEFLYQRGAPHSRKPEGDAGRRTDDALLPWLYRNSLGFAFAALFVASFAAYVAAGTAAYNHVRSLADQEPVGVGNYVLTGAFWTKTMQCWQAEFFAIAVYIVLSIYLRQEGSPESKPVGSQDDETGEANK